MPRLSRDDMKFKLRSVGLMKDYKPYQENAENGAILLETRRPVKIREGRMSGVEMDLYDDETVRVWTSQVLKARQMGKEHGFKVVELDGEAEIYIPTVQADLFLHSLGAKVKQKVPPPTPAQIEARKAFAAKRRTSRPQ